MLYIDYCLGNLIEVPSVASSVGQNCDLPTRLILSSIKGNLPMGLWATNTRSFNNSNSIFLLPLKALSSPTFVLHSGLVPRNSFKCHSMLIDISAIVNRQISSRFQSFQFLLPTVILLLIFFPLVISRFTLML